MSQYVWQNRASDLTVRSVDGALFYVHKDLLTSMSSFFAASLGPIWQQARSGIYTSADEAEPLRKLFHLLYTPDVAFSPPNHFEKLSELYIIADRYMVTRSKKSLIVHAFRNAAAELRFEAIPEFLAAATRLCRTITLDTDDIFTGALRQVDFQILRVDAHAEAWRTFRAAVRPGSPLFRFLAACDALRNPFPARPTPAYTTGCACTVRVPFGLTPLEPGDGGARVHLRNLPCHWCTQRYTNDYWIETHSGFQHLWLRIPYDRCRNPPGPGANLDWGTDDDE